ncbi:hypothetical protein JTP67_05910 [Streptomyces sp. S12]|uniref:hypothetical protein n=1 Tax=Streptomyces sp. NPDC057115 TaxID=3346022 RepID=UPI00196217EF|nr:hypothetical protein [Streptomyces sp. S12]
MSSDEQAPASGSVAHAFGNSLAWNWMPKMPASLKRSNVHTLLYTLRTIANADGTLGFKRKIANGDGTYRYTNGKPFTLKAIAQAAGADLKDTRDRMEAAIRAGVVTVVGERGKKGQSALYVIVPTPFPDWEAAAAYLDGVKAHREEARQKRATRKAAPWTEEKGGRPPVLDSPEKGGPPPLLPDGAETEERGTAPLPRKGDRPPMGKGDRPPYIPGGVPRDSQDGAEVGFQPQVVGAPEDQIDSHEHHHDTPPQPDPDDPDTWRICPGCRRRIMPSPWEPDRTVHARCETTTTRTNPTTERRPA